MSAAPPGQAPQRVCPRCSTIARTVDAHCPFCGSSYRRRGPWGALFFTAVLVTGAVLAGTLLLLVSFAGRLQTELDDQVGIVQRDLNRTVGRLEDRIQRDLDRRFPQSVAPDR